MDAKSLDWRYQIAASKTSTPFASIHGIVDTLAFISVKIASHLIVLAK